MEIPIPDPPVKKYKCKHGHKWEMEEESLIVFRAGEKEIPGVIYCPYCMAEFIKANLGAEEVL